jgi:glycosyltransferase involved in cell wall biosynthesis
MKEHKRIDYSIVIPAYNEEEYLPKTLARLRDCMKALNEFCGEIVVVDNNSTDRTAVVAQASGARVIFEEHRQISRARNAGAQAGIGKYIIFVDSDTAISPILFRKTLAALKSEECCGGGAIIEFDGHLSFFAQFALTVWLLLSKTFNWACGAYIFCLREAFIEIGGFDERYYASEEIHFSRSLRCWGKRKGKKFIILDEPIISSSRKLVWYSTWELLMMTFGLLLRFKSLQNRDTCYKMWYHRPEKSG